MPAVASLSVSQALTTSLIGPAAPGIRETDAQPDSGIASILHAPSSPPLPRGHGKTSGRRRERRKEMPRPCLARNYPRPT